MNAGLSLQEVASAVKVSPTTVFRWERLERVPHGEPAEDWALLLGELSRGGL
jgi:transcriptional regulator with XRE-family HTH domain